MQEISEMDKEIVRVLQDEFPLVEEPYKELARRVGISEQELIERIQRLLEEKKIRKMGAVLRHREVGYSANALCVWEVPKDRLEKMAANMSGHPAVSHCYDRDTAPDWPYNLYTMIHASSREECEEIAAELARDNQVSHRKLLYSKREWKKTSMRYFCESQLPE